MLLEKGPKNMYVGKVFRYISDLLMLETLSAIKSAFHAFAMKNDNIKSLH